MKYFDHIKAASYEEASELIRGNQKIEAIAGGTDVLGTYKDRLLPDYPDAVVGLKSIPDTEYIRDEGDYIAVGAGTRLFLLAKDGTVRKYAAALGDAAHSVASPIIRSTATIGGNICQDVRCWYYRYPHNIGGRLFCRRKGGDTCYAIAGENRYHSIFGGMSTGCSACSSQCPAGTDIPAYMEKIRNGDWNQAARIFFEYNPMPMMTSGICPHNCTDKCNQNVYGESVNIPAVERTLGDYILSHKDIYYAAPKRESGKKCAVVGAGPGGLSAAFYLRQAGHDVTIYDAHKEPGGVLRYGIPHYRLPKAIVSEFCDALKNIMGIKFRMETVVGRDISLEDIKSSCDAVYLGTGAWSQPVLGLEGENLTEFGLNFLTEVNTYLEKAIGEDVLVCGGGNVAMDVALTACRLGAKSVKLCCLEQRHEMPASDDEVEMAQEEGVKLYNGWGLGKVAEENGRVIGLIAKRCLSVRDASGRFNPVYDEEDTMLLKSDFIVLATGQRVDISFLGDNLSRQLRSPRGLIDADRDTGKTRKEGYYAGGDAVTGPNIAIRAIRAGHSAAMSMNRDLGSDPPQRYKDEKFSHFNVEGVEKTVQYKLKCLPAGERTLTGEDRKSFDPATAVREAERCLHCGCYAVNPSDITPVLVMLGASIVTTERIISAEDLFTQRLTVQMVLHRGELVKEIRVPKYDGVSRYDKRRIRDAIDFAIISLASALKVEDGVIKDARLVLGGVAPVPWRLAEVEEYLKGRRIKEKDTADEAGEIAMRSATPMSGNEYKIFMCKDSIYNLLMGLREG